MQLRSAGGQSFRALRPPCGISFLWETVFPFRGKLLNVREASKKKVSENNEISSLVKILGLQYGKVKADLFDTVMDYFRPFRDKREYLSNNLDDVLNHLTLGSEKATLVADKIIDKVRTATGLDYSLK